ncbi:hypothetical protein B0T11DRAFT_227403, partial [Plectosphaerella cucumerina]
ITGVSGHVGFRVLVEVLQRGYRARAVTRTAMQAEKINAAISVQPYHKQLEFVTVPDLALNGAFDGVLDGADGLVHVASPLPSAQVDSLTDFKRDLIDPAVNMTLEFLKAAKKVPSVRRIVITSSIGALLKWDYIISNDTSKVFTSKDTYTPISLEGLFANIIDVYGTSKAAALAATERFVQEEKPTWDVVKIMPSLVVGRNELNDGPEQVASGGNATPMGVLLETKNDIPTLVVSVQVDDVARAHIDALRPSIPGNRNYIFSVDTTWDDAEDIARRHFDEAVQKGVVPLAGSQPSRPLHFDTSETEVTFGWRLNSFEEQIKSVAGHYVDLVAAQ